VLALPSLREGQDFFEGESSSLICLEVLLNQQVGVERATAAALAIHHHYARPVAGLDRELGEATAWPYAEVPLRRPARSVQRLIEQGWQHSLTPAAFASVSCRMPWSAPLPAWNDTTTVAMPSLHFAPLRRVALSPEMARGLTAERFREITGMNFPAANLIKQLASAATLLEMKRVALPPTRADLQRGDRRHAARLRFSAACSDRR
jgi:hypothetical protein